MKTNELIQTLSQDAKNYPLEPADGLRVPFLFWFAGSMIIVLLSVWLLPVRPDLGERVIQPDFTFLALSWLGLTVLTSRLAILSAYPEEQVRKRWEFRAILAILGVLIAWVIIHFPTQNLAFEWYRERNYMNGGCGMVIIVSGLIHFGVVLRHLRKIASTHPGDTGWMLALSTGTFSTSIVQFACANENSIHVLLWHALPLSVLSVIGYWMAKKILRW